MRNIQQMMDLSGRCALITGGAGHIGSSAAEALAELGCHVVLLDCDQEKLALRKLALSNKFPELISISVLDLEDEIQIRQVGERLTEVHDEINILINCAAMVGTSQSTGWNTSFETQDSSTWRKSMEININAPMFLVQSLTKYLRKAKGASVINIASIYGLVGPDLRIYGDTDIGSPGAYAAAKGGLIQMTRWLSTVLAPQIRVNTISCGGVLRSQAEEFVKRYEGKTPLGRMATEEDFKGAIAYLASDMSSYVTGQNLVVDGGWTAW